MFRLRKALFSVTFILIYTFCNGQTPIIQLVNYASGFDRPVGIAHAQDDRLFVVEQDGTIRIIASSGAVLPTPFLNIDPIVGSSGNEQGLLGLAFHPNYASNGFFYVNYTDNSGDTRISRFSVSSVNPNIADPASELLILTFNQDFNNHNGGDINFGPPIPGVTDGYLYIATGDGGNGNDPNNRAQNPLSYLGKMLRIDVDNPSGGNNYGIPGSNPFVGSATTLNEIWALGLRNPWQFSFDVTTGDMWIGDVGQGNWEEIDFQTASSSGGENYGWRCYEGDHVLNTTGCGPIGNYTFPIIEYESNFPNGCSITGGYVYRGSTYPNMMGKYFYVDYCAGNFWCLEPNGNGGWTNTSLANLSNFEYSCFGEDVNKELYVAGLSSGIIYRITDNSILPIEFLNFNAKLNNKYVLLNWTTASEINSDYFSIERSGENQEYVEIDQVGASGYSAENKQYHFVDKEPLSGVSYYRLKTIDTDRSFEYSSIVSVKINDANPNTPIIYPNPAKSGSVITIQVPEVQGRLMKLSLYSIYGDELLKEIERESNPVQLDLPNNLAEGIYVLKINQGKETTYQQFIITK